MAGFFPAQPHPSLYAVSHKPLRLTFPCLWPTSLHHFSRRDPRISRLLLPASGKSRRNRIHRFPGGDDGESSSPPSRFTDEWGEIAEPEAESPSEADPPENDDEWGDEGGPGGSETVTMVTDEWGEKTEIEPENPADPDPPRDEDEWGNGIPTQDDKLGELKRCLVDSFYGTELGFKASVEARAEIVELVTQLEAQNPTPAPNEAPGLLDGNWILLYTAFSELLPLLAVGSIPALKIKKISQFIDTKNKTIVNATTLSSPLATFSFNASASFEVQSPSRIQVELKEGAVQPPEIASTLNLPEKVDIFGQKIDLQAVERLLNPIQQAVANVASRISEQPPLKLPIPGNRTKSWLLTTYLDQDFRISRGDGGLFVLAKEGSPLLDQLS